MSSSPLFIMVAESTEILRPMSQLGWAQACSGVTACSVSSGRIAKRPARGGEQDPLHADRGETRAA